MGKAKIQRKSMLIKSPKDSVFLMLFTQKQDCFIGFGVLFFLKLSAEKHPTTSTKYMPADVNCTSSYNKHESDHSVSPMYFVDNSEHQRTSAKKRYRTKPHWKLLLDWKVGSLTLFPITTGCCYCHSHLSVSPSNELLYILTQNLV